MDYRQLYESEKKKREAAEAKVTELQGVVRAAREDESLVDALRRVGVPAEALKDGATIMRDMADVTFDSERGTFETAELDGRIYLDPLEAARAFVRAMPNFTQAHLDAVAKDRGWATNEGAAKSTGEAGEAGEQQFTGAESWKNLDPVEIAELAWKNPPPAPPEGPDPFAEFIEERS